MLYKEIYKAKPAWKHSCCNSIHCCELP